MEKMPFTFIETNTTELSEGLFCDPLTGLCGPLPDKEKEADILSEKSDYNE